MTWSCYRRSFPSKDRQKTQRIVLFVMVVCLWVDLKVWEWAHRHCAQQAQAMLKPLNWVEAIHLQAWLAINIFDSLRTVKQMYAQELKGLTYQQPPGASLRSNTRIVSKAFSCAKASIAMAPPGPNPIIATRFAVILAPYAWRDRCLVNERSSRNEVVVIDCRRYNVLVQRRSDPSLRHT